ncbi:DUF3617 domain-containing protein [Ramlibacter sp.]|uniref:DUF3617 domain-containing protein n=1 Tax=Ramlibacter sp. TaxID=1917967 RepID=UPI001798ACF4|nr:DUF3617 domain-containing protein [Ramlibacter sp.]MBA2674398.1 DUF3617 domain-containing protein [Ramlibacter sp.]
MSIRVFVAAGLALASLAASAQSLKPGLWDITSKTQGGQMEQAQAEMRKQMAAMPPEQRKMMEDMLAKQGVKMGTGAGGMVMQICMTKEMTERNEIPMGNSDCKTTSQSRSGSTMKFAFACGNPPSSGEGEYTMLGSDAYKSRMTLKTVIAGKPDTMTMEGSGKWLAADCGSVKPLAVPKK